MSVASEWKQLRLGKKKSIHEPELLAWKCLKVVNMLPSDKLVFFTYSASLGAQFLLTVCSEVAVARLSLEISLYSGAHMCLPYLYHGHYIWCFGEKTDDQCQFVSSCFSLGFFFFFLSFILMYSQNMCLRHLCTLS
jgi:hypothetical protein